MFVFAYGSLMAPESLRRTLPGVAPPTCIPARCDGYVRTFSVAFPNEGSQRDKMYLDAAGVRPPVVLFCDMPEDAGRWVNGVCVPIDEAGLAALDQRELRYTRHTVSAKVTSCGSAAIRGPVVAYIGAAPFTSPADIERGVVHHEYLQQIDEGARFWDRTYPGFYADFLASTILPPASRIIELRRIDETQERPWVPVISPMRTME